MTRQQRIRALCAEIDARIPMGLVGGVQDIEAVVDVLRGDDALLAELMAVCARPGEAPWSGAWEFVEGADEIRGCSAWVPGGAGCSGTPATHYLPAPHRPPE